MLDRPEAAGPIFEEEVPPLAAPNGASGRGGALGFAALMLGNIVLAVGPWFVRLADVGPIASGFWRLALALPFIAAIAAADHRRRREAPVPIGLWALAGLAGLFFAADLACWHSGILRTKLANATLFGNISSFFFAGYGFLVAKLWPGRRQGLALLLAAAGTALLLGRSYELSPAHLAGDLLSIAAGVSYTGYLIAVERVRGRLGTWRTLAAATIAAALFLLPLAWALEGRLLPHLWWPLVALALGSQVLGQALMIYAIGALSPVVVGLGLLVQPLVASLIGAVMFGEGLGPIDLAGAAAIAAALVLVRRR